MAEEYIRRRMAKINPNNNNNNNNNSSNNNILIGIR
jgi:hypothetical protein